MSAVTDEAGLIGMIRTHTVTGRAPLVPELTVHLATHITPLWEATENLLTQTDMPPPFWAFTWPGGQALARYILDHPQLVAGRHVLDFGAGNGIQAIAAMMAGARSALANDIDPVSLVAARLNAQLNKVRIDTESSDLVGKIDPHWDLVIAGDVCYEQQASDAITEWLRRIAATGTPVLMADPGRSFAPTTGFEELESYEVPVEQALEDTNVMETGVWRMSAG